MRDIWKERKDQILHETGVKETGRQLLMPAHDGNWLSFPVDTSSEKTYEESVSYMMTYYFCHYEANYPDLLFDIKAFSSAICSISSELQRENAEIINRLNTQYAMSAIQ